MENGTPLAPGEAVTENVNEAPLSTVASNGVPLPPNVNVGVRNADGSEFVCPLALATEM